MILRVHHIFLPLPADALNLYHVIDFYFTKDRYILATMICVATVCFWHAIVTIVPGEWTDADRIALVVVAGLVIIYNLQFIARLYAIVSPWGCQICCNCVYPLIVTKSPILTITCACSTVSLQLINPV